MNVSNLIDRLNNELDKLNKRKENNNIDINSFFTNNEHFNDDVPLDNIEKKEEIPIENSSQIITSNYSDIEPNTEVTSLVEVKPSFIVSAQNMFKKTIKFSLKSFLISISISFLNLFI